MRAVLLVLAALGGLALLALAPPRTPEPAQPLPALRIDPNKAPEAILTILPRAGPSMVARLVAAREDRPFSSLQDIDRRVRGVGPRTIDRWRPYLSLEDEYPAPARATGHR